jgi:hypothetical protein
MLGKLKQDVSVSGGFVHAHVRDPLLASLPKEALEELASSYGKILSKHATPILDAPYAFESLLDKIALLETEMRQAKAHLEDARPEGLGVRMRDTQRFVEARLGDVQSSLIGSLSLHGLNWRSIFGGLPLHRKERPTLRSVKGIFWDWSLTVVPGARYKRIAA